MSLNLFYNILTVLEVIAVEFYSIWALSKRKHRFSICLGSYLAITIPLMLFMCFIAVRIPGYGDGSARFMALGFLYFIPALLNYGGNWRERIIIAFYSFSFGLGVFAVSVRIGYLFEQAYFDLSVLIIQTVLFAAILPLYLNFSRKKVVPYIIKANFHQKKLLLRYTIASFFLIILYNNIMVADGSMLRKLLVYLLLIYFIVLTYRLMVSYLQADDANHELNELARTDRLTGLGNRLALRSSLDEFIDDGKPFTILFLDLDNFKTINDLYGHTFGDKYLVSFAKAIIKAAGPQSPCFRLSGDEFICLTRDSKLFEQLSGFNPDWNSDIPDFLGVSFGKASYPRDARTASGLL